MSLNSRYAAQRYHHLGQVFLEHVLKNVRQQSTYSINIQICIIQIGRELGNCISREPDLS